MTNRTHGQRHRRRAARRAYAATLHARIQLLDDQSRAAAAEFNRLTDEDPDNRVARAASGRWSVRDGTW